MDAVQGHALLLSLVNKNNNNNNNNNNNSIQRRNSRFFTIPSLRHEPSPTRTRKWLLLSLVNNNNSNNNNNNSIQRRNSRFFTIPSLRHKPSPTRKLKWPGRNRVQIKCNTQSTYHVQHVVCHVVRRDSSPIKFDRVEIAFILALHEGIVHLLSLTELKLHLF